MLSSTLPRQPISFINTRSLEEGIAKKVIMYSFTLYFISTSVFSPIIPTISSTNVWALDMGFNCMHFWAKLYLLSSPWFRRAGEGLVAHIKSRYWIKTTP